MADWLYFLIIFPLAPTLETFITFCYSLTAIFFLDWKLLKSQDMTLSSILLHLAGLQLDFYC